MSEARFHVHAATRHAGPAQLLGGLAFALAGVFVALAFYGTFRFGEASGVGGWEAVGYAAIALVVGGVAAVVITSFLHRRLSRDLREQAKVPHGEGTPIGLA